MKEECLCTALCFKLLKGPCVVGWTLVGAASRKLSAGGVVAPHTSCLPLAYDTRLTIVSRTALLSTGRHPRADLDIMATCSGHNSALASHVCIIRTKGAVTSNDLLLLSREATRECRLAPRNVSSSFTSPIYIHPPACHHYPVRAHEYARFLRRASHGETSSQTFPKP